MGLMAWALRYGLFAWAAPSGTIWMMIAGIIIHGACYDFVYVASQVYIDKNISPQFRAQAQGFFVLVSYGIGQGLGTLTAGWIFNSIMKGNSSSPAQWQTFWIIPLLFAVFVTIMFMAGFKEKVEAIEENS